jgi:hypothetical protein
MTVVANASAGRFSRSVSSTLALAAVKLENSDPKPQPSTTKVARGEDHACHTGELGALVEIPLRRNCTSHSTTATEATSMQLKWPSSPMLCWDRATTSCLLDPSCLRLSPVGYGAKRRNWRSIRDGPTQFG